MDDATNVHAALLATLEPGVLHAHCNAFLRRELTQTQRSVDDAAAALQRLREVTRAAQKLQLQSGSEPLLLSFRAVSKLRRKVTRVLKRANMPSGGEFLYAGGADAGAALEATSREEALVQSRETAAVERGAHYLESDPPPDLQQPVGTRERDESLCSLAKNSSSADAPHFEEIDTGSADVEALYFIDKQGEQHHPTSTRDPAAACEMEQSAEEFEILALPHNASHYPEQGDDMEKPPLVTRKRPREEASVRNIEARAASPQLVVGPDAKPDTLELYEVLLRMKELYPHGEFVTIVQREMNLPANFESNSPADRVAAIRKLAAGIKKLSAAPMCKHGSEITQKQRLTVAGVIIEAVSFFTKFVVAIEPSSEPALDASELLAMLDCIGSTKGVFRDSKATLARLRQSERDLTEYAQRTHESKFQEWELDRKLTGNKRREFENMRDTLNFWIESRKCRGSALDRLMDQFESLLTKSLSLWDVTKDDVVRACVDAMTTVASVVDSTIEKCAARLKRLEVFRNILSNDVPAQSARGVRAMNLENSRR